MLRSCPGARRQRPSGKTGSLLTCREYAPLRPHTCHSALANKRRIFQSGGPPQDSLTGSSSDRIRLSAFSEFPLQRVGHAIFLAAAKTMTLGFRVIGREGVAMMGKAAGSRPRQVPWVVSCLSGGHCKLAHLVQRTSGS